MSENGAFLRRRRVAARRRPGGRVRAVTAIAFVAAAGLGLVRLSGKTLVVERLEISGNRRARTEEVLSALAPWVGRNLLTLDLSPLAERLSAHPWIEGVTISKRFPDGLAVRVSERRAVALLRETDGLWWLANDGRPIAPYDPRDDRADYILVTAERRVLSEAVGLLADLSGGEPEYFSALSEITALPGGGFGMMDSIFRTPVRVLRKDAPEKIRALLDARSLIETRGWEARAIDLRFADRIVLVGAYGVGSSL
ncbi:MAG: cell division protein FtsQ/DivIB [Thermoanaerobaculia bacterium]